MHNIANAAPSTGYRYRYYTCFSRQRYGTPLLGRTAPRRPAGSEVRGALLRTVRRHDLEAALAAGLARSGAQRRQYRDELGVWMPS